MTQDQAQDYDTTYFPAEIVADGVRGCCHQFAMALHRRTGWPLAVLWREPLLDQFTISRFPNPLHVFCLAPDGRAIDVEGPVTEAGMIARWTTVARRYVALRIEAYADEDAYKEAMREEPMLIPSDRAVSVADRVIAKSKPFLGLIDELAGRKRFSLEAAHARLKGHRSLLSQLSPEDRAAILADEGPEAAGEPGGHGET